MDKSKIEIQRCFFDFYGYDTVSGSGDLNPAVIKNSPGQLFGWYIFNNSAVTIYCNFYNTQAGNVVPGATAVFMSFGIPAGLGANVPPSPRGINFNKAMAFNFSTLRGGIVTPPLTIDYNFWFDLPTRTN